MAILTPVAMFIFNRPELTKRVFERIALIKPKKLFVVADGPRFPEEAVRCQQARAIIDQISWTCDLRTNFSDANLGCKRRISSGLDWVFSQEEEAIVLEDDCLPVPSFFTFCQTLLETYRHDERVLWITGNNFQDGQRRTGYSYYFSKYSHIWGWASWRRTWKSYDVAMTTWPEYKSLGLLKEMSDLPEEYAYWTGMFDMVFEGILNTWDIQALYMCWIQHGLTIIPNVNLVANIGFDQNATHTKIKNRYANLPTEDLWSICHPRFPVRHRAADLYTFENLFRPEISQKEEPMTNQRTLWTSSLKNILLRIARRN